MTDWQIHGRELANCNCAYGCPCQFNALPTHGTCEAVVAFAIDTGFYGDTRLDGLLTAATYKWPGAVHEGNGEMQIIIDPRADDAQRTALERIMTGADTADMATMWWVFSAMAPRKHETLYRPIRMEVDIAARTGVIAVEGVFETRAEPIRNPVTGAEHRARIDLPHGFEYNIAEVGSGTSRTFGAVEISGNIDSYAQFCELHLSQNGPIRDIAA
ncbi:DUF1326 domain-containing protein [Paroceanicella profunda]|uniref:DUF1326 domain-containing protein n=1 Tax=Paroceanicella profunda TaxID=2579971 RepID=A0A5B8FTZ9_9RHOB|nr:DUF1326 domain-containing protein [Paroceanicella profunda]QDL90560.1 DUF1326 domain-containing protein [Paroceanicella profunda]